jgi:hypothetical protein
MLGYAGLFHKGEHLFHRLYRSILKLREQKAEVAKIPPTGLP